MKRLDALSSIYTQIKDYVVVTNMGAVAVELYSLGHRPNFFYLEHSMGLASSVGLGLALSLPGSRVIVIDGDGSVLMNLGTLSTMARYNPPNLTHLIFDNESLLSVGGFPTATSTGADLAGIATTSGVSNVSKAGTVEELSIALAEAIHRAELSVLVASVEAVGPTSYHMDISLLENRFQFQRYIRGMGG